MAVHAFLLIPALWLAASPAMAESASSLASAVPASVLPAARHARGLLWRIETEGAAPSYLFGTIHLSDPRVTDLPAPVRRAFEQAASFTMETFINASGLLHMAEAMFFNDGRTLDRLLGEELYAALERAFGKRGLPTRDLNRKKPWAALLSLSAPPRQGPLFLDLMLLWEATLADKPHYKLETMEEQLAVFNDMPLDEQVTLLRDTLLRQENLYGQYESLIQAYLARDLDRLMRLVYQNRPPNGQVFDSLLGRLLDERNRRMLERMRPRLREGNAFIAVGAGHLPGEQGLLNLLERSGYRVTSIY